MWKQPGARLRAMWRSLGCSPSETLALAILAAGALAAVGVLWLATAPDDTLWAPDSRGPRDGSAEPEHAIAAEAGDDAVANGNGAEGLPVTETPLTVHVAGAVVTPGVVDLPGGSRVADALQAVGGPTESAALEAVNLARPLNDGEQLYVPDGAAAEPGTDGGEAPAESAPEAPTNDGTDAVRPDGTLDLNRADNADFEELPGVGPVLAERIVDHRESVGGFTSVGDLRDVAGIGEVRFQELADLVGL